jgi:hypothetical protein
MKKILIIILLITVSFCSKAQQTYAQQYSYKITEKMKDTLLLSESVKTRLYNINIDLQNKKAAVWQQYTNPDSLSVHLQQIENSRDSLYEFLFSNQQMVIYKQKKNKLISNN